MNCNVTFSRAVSLIKIEKRQRKVSVVTDDASIEINMDIEEVKKYLEKPATKFITDSVSATQFDEESWLGKVTLYQPDEGSPKNETSDEMLPYSQLHLPSPPFNSPALVNARILSLFMSEPFPEPFELMEKTG
jgi:hypothetical protein